MKPLISLIFTNLYSLVKLLIAVPDAEYSPISLHSRHTRIRLLSDVTSILFWQLPINDTTPSRLTTRTLNALRAVQTYFSKDKRRAFVMLEPYCASAVDNPH